MYNIFDEIFKIVEKDELNSKHEFDNLMFFLTNHPAPLREVCAYKLEEYSIDEFIDDNTVKIILNSICDINPNVSRSICKVIKNNPLLQNKLTGMIIDKINAITDTIPKKEKISSNKNHAKNKIFFSLYWLLEALYYCESARYNNEILEILHSVLNFSDYTIREKAAKLLTKIPNPPSKLVELIKLDSNFYVNFYSKFI